MSSRLELAIGGIGGWPEPGMCSDLDAFECCGALCMAKQCWLCNEKNKRYVGRKGTPYIKMSVDAYAV